MVATPYTGVATFRGRRTGQTYSQPFTATDVNNAVVTWTNTGLTAYSPVEDVDLVDIQVTAAGVDTSLIKLLVDGADSGLAWLGATVKSTIPLPRLPSAVGIAGRAAVQFKQAT